MHMFIHVRNIETRENAKIIIIIIIKNLIHSKIIETLPKPPSDKQNRINLTTDHCDGVNHTVNPCGG